MNRFSFENNGRASKWLIDANVGASASASRWNLSHTGQGEILSISGDGNVGILNDNPSLPLHVNSQDISTSSSSGAFAIGRLTENHLIFDNDEINAYSNTAGTTLFLNEESDGAVRIGGGGILESNLLVSGYSQLGSTGPTIKMKKMTGTTDADANTSVTHSLDKAKIISITALINSHVDESLGFWYPPRLDGSSSTEYRIYIGSTQFHLGDVGTSLQGKPYRILITYEE